MKARHTATAGEVRKSASVFGLSNVRSSARTRPLQRVWWCQCGTAWSLFQEVCDADTSIIELDDVYRVVIAQEDHDGVLIDTEDRVVRGAAVLNALAEAGL
jgi:hypothetical protein